LALKGGWWAFKLGGHWLLWVGQLDFYPLLVPFGWSLVGIWVPWLILPFLLFGREETGVKHLVLGGSFLYLYLPQFFPKKVIWDFNWSWGAFIRVKGWVKDFPSF